MSGNIKSSGISLLSLHSRKLKNINHTCGQQPWTSVCCEVICKNGDIIVTFEGHIQSDLQHPHCVLMVGCFISILLSGTDLWVCLWLRVNISLFKTILNWSLGHSSGELKYVNISSVFRLFQNFVDYGA
jgi:hypothetical protein